MKLKYEIEMDKFRLTSKQTEFLKDTTRNDKIYECIIEARI